MDKVIVYRSRSEAMIDSFLWDNPDIIVNAIFGGAAAVGGMYAGYMIQKHLMWKFGRNKFLSGQFFPILCAILVAGIILFPGRKLFDYLLLVL